MRGSIYFLPLILFLGLVYAETLRVGFALPVATDEFRQLSVRVENGLRFWAQDTKDFQLGKYTATKGAKYNNFTVVTSEPAAGETLGDVYVRLASETDVLVIFDFSCFNNFH